MTHFIRIPSDAIRSRTEVGAYFRIRAFAHVSAHLFACIRTRFGVCIHVCALVCVYAITAGTAVFVNPFSAHLSFCENLASPQTLVEPSKKGPHGGKVLKSPHGLAELKMDNKKIHIYLPRHPEKNPTGINVTFYDKENRTYTVDLKKLDQLPLSGSDTVHYQGELNPAQTSYMGLQITIPLSKGDPAVIEDRPSTP